MTRPFAIFLLLATQLATSVLWCESASAAAGAPLVLLTEGHKKLCRVGVGDALPIGELSQLSGPATRLSALQGKKATVVVFWASDRWMSRAALTDLARETRRWGRNDEIRVVGIAVGLSANDVQTLVDATGATFPQLLDSDASAFAQVGFEALPRIFVLDDTGAIAWFDIEYGEATRRELRLTLEALTSR